MSRDIPEFQIQKLLCFRSNNKSAYQQDTQKRKKKHYTCHSW